MSLLQEHRQLLAQLDSLMGTPLLPRFHRDPAYGEVFKAYVAGIGQAIEAVARLQTTPPTSRTEEPEPAPEKPKSKKKLYLITFDPGHETALLEGSSSTEANGKASEMVKRYQIATNGWSVMPVERDDLEGLTFINMPGKEVEKV